MPDDIEDEEPELAGFEPVDQPLRPRYLTTAVRVVAVVGLVGLILPGILVTVGTANRTDSETCAAYVAFDTPEAVDFDARFELLGEAGIGWNCYAEAFGGGNVLIKSLGLIPGGARLPQVPVENE